MPQRHKMDGKATLFLLAVASRSFCVVMDTGKLILWQLDYAARMARTEEQRLQVAWWVAKIEELRDQQPSAEPAAVETPAQESIAAN